MSTNEERGVTLEDAVTSGMAAVLNPERMSELVERKLAEVVDGWVDDALQGWNNPVQKAFQSRVQELIVPAIERVRLDNARLDVLLSALIEQGAIGERARVLDRFGKLVMAEVPDVASASDLFDRWCACVREDYDCDGRKVEFDDGPHYEPLECVCELQGHESPSWSCRRSATLVLEVADCDETQRDLFNRTVELWRFDTLPDDDDAWYVHYPPRPTIRDIAGASQFDLYLSRLSSHGACIRWDLGYGGQETVYPDQEPEADWS